MARALVLFLLCSLSGMLCHAETPWCNSVEKVSSDPILYPPIGRAARVSGVTVIELTIDSAGAASATKISGPTLLLTPAVSQLQKWRFRTDGAITPCQALAIISFQFGPSSITEAWRSQPEIGNILRISIRTEPLVISDPAIEYTRAHRFLQLFRFQRRYSAE